MTMILAANLSQKLIIAGDTRVTRRTEGEQNPIFIDNIVKVLPLWSKQNLGQAFYNQDSIAIAVAGDVYFASFLHQKVQRAFELKELSTDIRVFSDQIKDFVAKASDEWLESNPYSHCALIFAGITPRRKKKVSLEKLEELKTAFKKDRDDYRKMREESTEKALREDPIMIEIDKKIKESGRAAGGIREVLQEGENPVVSAILQQALDSGKEEIDMPDSLLVGVDIDHEIATLNVETAEWGEMLGYGSKLTKEKVDTSLAAFFELTHVKDTNARMFEATLMRQSILDHAKKNNTYAIGGDVVIFSVEKDGTIDAQAPGLTHDLHTGASMMLIHGKTLPMQSYLKLAAMKSSNEKDKLELSITAKNTPL